MVTDRQLLETILEKLEKLEISHDELKIKVCEIHKNTNRMEHHIDFVEKTYEKVKTPFHYLMEKVSLLTFSSFRKSEITQSEKENEENEENQENK